MPIPLQYQDKEENQEPSDFIIFQLTTVLEHGGERNPRIDETIRDVTLPQIDEYMDKIKLDQDLPFQLVRIRSKQIPDEKTFKEISEHCNVTDVAYNERLKHKLYFIETASNAIVFIPIQLEEGLINICVELLDKENTIESIYKMYEESSKLTIDQIKFVKFSNK